MDFGLPSTILNSFDFGFEGNLIWIIIGSVFAIAITRNTRHLRLLLFPIFVGLWRVGADIHLIVLMLVAVLWVITLVGTHYLGSMMSSIGSGVGTVIDQTRYVTGLRQKQRIDKGLRTEKEALHMHKLTSPFRHEKEAFALQEQLTKLKNNRERQIIIDSEKYLQQIQSDVAKRPFKGMDSIEQIKTKKSMAETIRQFLSENPEYEPYSKGYERGIIRNERRNN